MINTITLNNGVRIITEQIESVRSLSIGVWIKTGSRFEQKDENGISHFLEHMLFKGTTNRTAADIASAFDRIGGHVNAFTSKEYTCYYTKVLDEHALYAVDILADMFFNSSFSEDEMDKEKKVVYEEIKMVDDTPDDIVHELLSEASYGDHALAYPILGTVEQLYSFTDKSLREYMGKYYTGDHVVISIAGNIKTEMVEQLKNIFSAVPPTTYTPPYTKPSFIPKTIVKKKETEQSHICIGFPGLAVGENNVFSLILLNNLLGGSMSSRLFQEIREKRGLCYSVFSYHTSYIDSGILTIYAGTAHEQLNDLTNALFQTIDELGTDGLSDVELNNSKEQLKGSLILSLESPMSRMSRNGKNEILRQKHRSLDELIEQINAVTLQDVNDLAGSILNVKPSISLINNTGKMPTTVYAQ